MNPTSKKLFVLVPALVFVALVFGMPSIASAFSGSGAGTSVDPFGITTCTQLQEMNDSLTATYRLDNNIDCSATTGWNAGAGFEPVGSGSVPFSGTFRGNQKTITGLFIDRPTESHVALFAATTGGAALSNVGLEDVDITGNDLVGGLVGHSDGPITNSYTTGSVTSSTIRAGGLAGENDDSITNSYSTASVTGTNYVGGLVGNGQGGGTINKSYAAGSVVGVGVDVGGLAGSYSGTAIASFWDTETSGQATSAGGAGATGKTTAEMKTESTFTGAGWDFTSIWDIDGVTNSGYPFISLPTDRYWVGNSGTWNGVDSTHWAYTSGGAGGASVPTSTNDCFFDANSFSGGGQTVTVNNPLTLDAFCRDMTWTTTDAPTLDVTGHHLYLYGSLTFASGMAVVGPSPAFIYFLASTGTHSITTNGATIGAPLFFGDSGGTWELGGNLNTNTFIQLAYGTFDANGFDVTADSFQGYDGAFASRSLMMGSGTWTLTGTVGNVWDITSSTSLTFDAGTSTIDITDTGAGQKEFIGGGLTYNEVTISGKNIEIRNSNTFDTLNVNNAGFPTLFINNDTIQTLTNFTTNGSVGNLTDIGVSTPLTPPFIFSKASGTVSVDYMYIYGSTATGGALWYAGANSIDGGGNTGWIFTPPSAASTPIAAPVAGTYTGTQNVTLSSAGSTTIRYTTDSSTPTCLVGTLYGGAISVSSSLTVKAVGCDGSSIASPVASFAYVINMSSGGGGGGGGGGYFTGFTPSPTPSPTPTFTPTPMPLPQLPTRGDPANLARFGLREGDVMGARPEGDPDVFIVNPWGYKRLFLNPVIFGFYGHLGGFASVKSIGSLARDAFPTSGLFRNCETGDPKVYAVEVTGEDTGTLHHVNIAGDVAVSQDPEFFKKVFCINNSEFNWYLKSPTPYTSLMQVPAYRR